MLQCELDIVQILGSDSINPRAVVGNGPLGLHEGVQQYIIGIFGIHDANTTECLGIDLSRYWIGSFAHFTINGNGGGVGSKGLIVGAGGNPIGRSGNATGPLGLLTAFKVEGIGIVGVTTCGKDGQFPFHMGGCGSRKRKWWRHWSRFVLWSS